jgi:hypothetical protein
MDDKSHLVQNYGYRVGVLIASLLLELFGASITLVQVAFFP